MNSNIFMTKYLLTILILLSGLNLFAQAEDGEEIEDNRRANYFETYIEVTKPIDSIVVFKSKRELICFNQKNKLKKYIISLGLEPLGTKQFEGDFKTPEGLYFINNRDTISSYHTNLAISYPSTEDSTFAALQNKSAGGDIKIHGFPNKHLKNQEKDFLNTDWTLGCIAVSDMEIDELYKWVIVNCPILILP